MVGADNLGDSLRRLCRNRLGLKRKGVPLRSPAWRGTEDGQRAKDAIKAGGEWRIEDGGLRPGVRRWLPCIWQKKLSCISRISWLNCSRAADSFHLFMTTDAPVLSTRSSY